jgi:hypothetical protein
MGLPLKIMISGGFAAGFASSALARMKTIITNARSAKPRVCFHISGLPPIAKLITEKHFA